MAGKDLFDEPFDDGTIAKLEIFEDYAQAWIPTWVMQKVPEIHVFDFFAGTGYDKNKIPGSPIRLLQKTIEHKGNLFKMNVQIYLHFNAYDTDKTKSTEKFEQLKVACAEFLNNNKGIEHKVSINFYNQDLEELFPKLLPKIKKFPSLVYLDQNGIKFLSEKYFLELEKSNQTDFLYFVSSSYFWRFGDKKEFKSHLDIDMEEAKKNPYQFIHRHIINELRAKLPNNSKLRLYPFTIKKGANIHGIIFGAKHLRAVDKFLAISWKKNEVNGEANFDIDEDNKKGQLDIFEGRKHTKKEAFLIAIEEAVQNGNISNNREALQYAYELGHIPKHAAERIKMLKKEKKITYDCSSPLVTYDNVFKKKRYLNYKRLNHE